MTTDVRTLAAGDWPTFYARLERAFGVGQDAVAERELAGALAEHDRTLVAWDGDEPIGTASAFSFRMTVPGGALAAAAGVTMVSVQPTHRRRGVLTAMMRRQLDDVHERGEPLAVLQASEPAIYGRFGYGVATWQLHGRVDTAHVVLHAPPGAADVRMRLVSPAEAVERCEAVYAAKVPGRPGMLARQPGWERMPLLDEPSGRNGACPLLCVLAEVHGDVRGYARYAAAAHWSSECPDGSVNLRDVEALDPVTYAALWRYLAGIDLMSSVAFSNRPADDPLLHLVSDVRRCSLGLRDDLHLRLVDLPAALSQRTYARPVDTVLEVEDAFCPWNSGRWRLSGDARGATCERTGAAAEISLAVRELGAAYLGGPSLTAMAGAGLAREARDGALAAVSAAFRSDVQPWLPHHF